MGRIADYQFLIILGVVTLMASSPSVAMPKQHGLANSGTVHIKHPTAGVKSTPLSESECKDLGGSVIGESSGICNSGKYCKTVDENQKKHFVCIAKAS
jgi:hypothetical protein